MKRTTVGLTIVLVVIIVVAAVAAVVFYARFLPDNSKTQTMNFTGFTALKVSSAFRVTITQSDTYSVVITASESIFDQVEVNNTGNTLEIGVRPGTYSGSIDLEARITMPRLDSIGLSGATQGTATGFSSTDPFAANLSGASSLVMTNFKAGNLTIELSGASSLTAHGSANGLVSALSGASGLNLSNLPVNDAGMTLGGASHAQIDVNGRLDANLSGASSLEYSGSPTLGNISASGFSSISKE